MISIKKLRENKDSYQNGLKLKGDSTDLDTIITLDIKVRSIKRKSNEMRAERNNASEAIGNAKKAGEDASKAILKNEESSFL